MPEVQQKLAQQIGATPTRIAASHMPILSQPDAVVEAILQQ
ncbi:hypothetical protein ACUHGC_11780 [Testudinibacter sp. P27/CKL/0425]